MVVVGAAGCVQDPAAGYPAAVLLGSVVDRQADDAAALVERDYLGSALAAPPLYCSVMGVQGGTDADPGLQGTVEVQGSGADVQEVVVNLGTVVLRIGLGNAEKLVVHTAAVGHVNSSVGTIAACIDQVLGGPVA